MDKFEKLAMYVLDRMQEPSTLRGFITLLMIAFGYSLDDARLEAWVTMAVIVSGALKIVLPDSFKK